MKIYKSKVDWWVYAVCIGTVVICMVGPMFDGDYIAGIILSAVMLVIEVFCFTGVRYAIKSEDTKFTHEFMFVITSLPTSVSAEKVLEYYRLRWQVELVFKRYKSLLGLGNIPTKTKESSEVWLNGKMFLALLIEKYLGDIDFSPSWNIRTEPEHMERDEIGTLFDLYDAVSK